MSNGVYIEDYTEKSFVVRGETREHKDSLKAMGGKWNGRLTDKSSGEKFGAWLFWSDKRKELDDWLGGGCTKVDQPQQASHPTSNNDILRLERKIDNLTRMIEQLCQKNSVFTVDVSGDDDVVEVKPHRKLL